VSNVGTISVEDILPLFQHTGGRNYVGRHRVEYRPPMLARAARRIADEWNKPRAILPPVRDRHDLLIGQTFRDVSNTIATTWRSIDRAAYARIPATWRHRLETSARQRTERAQLIDDTETWWINRRDDYPVLVETQAMPVIHERTPTP
jgi:hypothetical protein